MLFRRGYLKNFFKSFEMKGVFFNYIRSLLVRLSLVEKSDLGLNPEFTHTALLRKPK